MKKVFSILFLISLASCSTSKKQKLDQEFKNRKGQAPFLNQPEVRTIWVPDKIEGNTYIEGHYVHVIDKNTTWKGN